MEVLAPKLDELVGNANKSIYEIKPGKVSSYLCYLGILDNFLENFDVFGTAIDALEECFVMAGVYITVGHHEGV